MAEYVPVRASTLVSETDQWPGYGTGRVRARLAPARPQVAQMSPGQLFQHQLGEVASPVKPGINDQPFTLDLGQEVAMKCGVTGIVGVREVDIAHTALGLLMNPAAV